MNENILKAQGVELLCQYTNNDKLVKFIATLPKYKINTLYDVKMVKRTIINSIPGFGETKWRRLEEVRDVLNNNIQEIISASELAGADIVEIGSETPNTVNHTAILNDIPETVMSIPIYWLLESGEVSSDYESIIRNTLKGYTIKDILTLDVCKLSQLRGVGIHKQEMVIKFKESVLSIVTSHAWAVLWRSSSPRRASSPNRMTPSRATLTLRSCVRPSRRRGPRISLSCVWSRAPTSSVASPYRSRICLP